MNFTNPGAISHNEVRQHVGSRNNCCKAFSFPGHQL